MNSFRISILTIACIAVVGSTSFAKQEDQKEGQQKQAEQEKPVRPFLGVAMSETENRSGVMVAEVVPDSPAMKAGIQAKDVITKIDSYEIADSTQIRTFLGQQDVGDVLKLTLQRDGKEITVDLTLGKRPDDDAFLLGGAKIASEDGLEVRVDPYLIGNAKMPFIVLCHQAGWSRGEYREIAPKLNKLGFNCLAIDQRSGGEVNDVTNETAKLAIAAGKETKFVDAEQDMIAALKWARENHAEGKLILWGSSYSAALAIRIAGEHPDLVDGVLAFAPGEYFARFDKPEDWITTSAKKIKVPVFITSAKGEAPKWKAIFEAIPGDTKSKFVPETKGNHGSRALWEKFDDSADYWKQVEGFLGQFK